MTKNMNDRYLYRAKRTDNGEWVKGFYFCMEHTDKRHAHHFIIPLGVSLEKGTPIEKIQVEVDPSTICQCTGKHDIPENKMIYEHDFVSFLDTYSTENGYAEQYCIGEVLWDDEELCFYVTNRLSAESYEVLDDCKVIGNRFDNPELLEVGE